MRDRVAHSNPVLEEQMDLTLGKASKRSQFLTDQSSDVIVPNLPEKVEMVEGTEALATLCESPRFSSAYFEREAVHSAKELMRNSRESVGLTQSEVAERLGVDRKSITAGENSFARDTITLKTIVRHLNACGFRLEITAVPIQGEAHGVKNPGPKREGLVTVVKPSKTASSSVRR
jgi:DNA-binding XRE family transcriptional regulator